MAWSGMDNLLSMIFGSNSLEYYDYDTKSDLNTVLKWYKTVKEVEETVGLSMDALTKEAKNTDDKPGSRMKEYLERAMIANKSASGLKPEECLVVTMYTDDSDKRAFFREYNRASTDGRWSPYKVYTALLMSALRKLAKDNPIPSDRPLYRGLRIQLNPPTAKRIFWKSFASATVNPRIAQENFAGPDGIILEFQSPGTLYGAPVGNLSFFAEGEVILPPFEVFDVLPPSGRKFNFKSCTRQKLLGVDTYLANNPVN